MNTDHDEADSLGAVSVPDDAWYGAQSMRARLNFPNSQDGS
jgi:aspartate ammonia-lyase